MILASDTFPTCSFVCRWIYNYIWAGGTSYFRETGFLSAMPWSAAGSKLQEKARYGEQEKKELKQEDY